MAIQESINLTRILTLEAPGYDKVNLARRLYQSSDLLFDADRYEEALKDNQEAVDLYRALVTERPTTALKSCLAISLGGLAIILERSYPPSTGTDLLAIHEEVVQLSRTLIEEQPANEKYSRDLAWALKNLSQCLLDRDRDDEALLVIQEALAQYQEYYEKFGAYVDIVFEEIPECTRIEERLHWQIARKLTTPTEVPSGELRVSSKWERCYECL